MKKLTTEEFIDKANKVHNNRYDYSRAEYKNSQTKICIVCPKHGEFWQTPAMHLYGNGCPKCNAERNGNRCRKTIDEFSEEAKRIHNNKYDYSKVKYRDTHFKVCIICPEHGEFWQTPHCHLKGQGCPICRISHLENEIKMMLDENNIEYEYQKHFDWLGKQSIDFYIPSKKIAIECQGSQHFIPYDFFGGDNSLIKIIKRDLNKKRLCEENNIKLLYYGKYKSCIRNKKIILNEIL